MEHDHAGGTDNEQTSLLGHKRHVTVNLASHLHQHMTRDVSKNWADLVLLSCYLITGLLDSSSTLIWGSFLSMQTGQPCNPRAIH